jgi:chromosome partitioning protein
MTETVNRVDESPAEPDTRHGFGPAPAPGTPRYPTATGYDLLASDPSTPLAVETDEQLRALQRSREIKKLPRPDSTRVLVVANQKGGVGKTTSTVNVAAALAQHDLRVLVIDLDPQGNASTALRIEHTEGTPGIYDALVDGRRLSTLIQPCPDVDGLLVVPATIDLAGAEIELVSLVARESRLRRSVDEYLDETRDDPQRVDYILIDCPPSLGLLTVNALVAGRELLIPIQCEYYALEGLGQLLRNIELIQSHLNPELVISTIMLTMHDARTRLSAGVADEVRSHFGDKVLNTAVPRSVRISEAPSYQQTVMTYDPTSPGALSYLEAARELASRLNPADPTDRTSVAETL